MLKLINMAYDNQTLILRVSMVNQHLIKRMEELKNVIPDTPQVQERPH